MTIRNYAPYEVEVIVKFCVKDQVGKRSGQKGDTIMKEKLLGNRKKILFFLVN